MAQSCDGSAARQGCKRMAARAPATAAKEPTNKQARKQATTQANADELVSPKAMDFLKEHGVSKASIEPVIEVMKNSKSGLSKEASDFLVAILPWSLAVPVDKRQEAQQTAVLCLDSVFGAVEAELQQLVDEEVSNIDELKAELAELVGAAEQAEITSKNARDAMEEQGKVLTQMGSSLVQAREALGAAEREEARLGDELSQTQSLMSELEGTLTGSFKRLKVADFEDGEAEGLVKYVMAAIAKCCLEEALVTTLPSCLAKREHGSFDLSVIGEAEKCIQGKIAALQENVQAAASPMEAQAVAVREARAALGVAVTEQAQAADKMCTAQAESSETAANAEAAHAAASLFGTKLAPAQEVADARRSELDLFLSYNVFLFQLLRDRTTDTGSVNESVAAEESSGSVKESVVAEEGAVLPASLAGA